MDTRSSAGEFLSQPEGALEALSKVSRVDFPNLFSARAHTHERLASLREELESHCESDEFSVVLFGSWARKELTPHSDDDWAIVVGVSATESDTEVQAALSVTRDRLGQGAAKPGSQDIFGQVFMFEDLVN